MIKPNWNDAPGWAQWLAQDADGQWTWFEEKPTTNNFYAWDTDKQYSLALNDYENENWQSTLEERSNNNSVNHPAHYNQIAGIECIDVARHFDFNLGNSLKYIWRAYHKGATIEDLQKAVWYLQDEIKMLQENQ